ncbi:MAG: alpha/beta hydrolase [Gammaproteobacteria bacterium]|nr:alpha/beta hydrolase [Gammaproteobacteria bacterium]
MNDGPTTVRVNRFPLAEDSWLAYEHLAGHAPTIVFFPGLRSAMTGQKAMWLRRYCLEHGLSYLRFDYRGHGVASGRFEDHTIADWLDDADVLTSRLCEPPLLLVGSSMGAWIMTLLALRCPERVSGMLGIAAAPDFTAELMSGRLSEEQLSELRRCGRVELPSRYDEQPTVITRSLIEAGNRLCVLDRHLDLQCPLRLVHGLRDIDVPWQRSLALLDRFRGADATLTLVKDGEHRLSRQQDLVLVGRLLDELLDTSKPGSTSHRS